ncbi:unnamed protein product [Vicia faba]|uniref:Pseudouridine synthase RsuA/RluA-like domain-containing protein n=1 Tax=Vicia faba TaxID=3906 RepID=A0AAV0ZF84_VICFA|nr:unnamed protein product [Vicia faba]
MGLALSQSREILLSYLLFAWNNACEATYQRYWALVIGTPNEKEGIIHTPISKVLMNDGKTERVMLGYHSSIKPHQEVITEYRVLGLKINGCSWIEIRPLTYRKHQVFLAIL